MVVVAAVMVGVLLLVLLLLLLLFAKVIFFNSFPFITFLTEFIALDSVVLVQTMLC